MGRDRYDELPLLPDGTIRVLRVWKQFAADVRGNFAIVLAVLSVPMALMLGIAIDYGRGTSDRSAMQNALDAASLAVIGNADLTSLSARQTALGKVYAANLGLGQASIVSTEFLDGQIVMATKAEYDSPLTFMRMGGLGRDNQRVSVNSSVGVNQQLDSIAFKAIKATGWWDKVVKIMGRKEGTTTYTELGNVQYQWNGVAGGTLSLGNTTISALRNGKFETTYRQVCLTALLASCIVSTNNGNIDATGIDDLYLEMAISAPTFKLAIDDLKSRKNLPLVIRTDDPALSNRLYVDGKQQPMGQVVNVFRAIGCGNWVTQQWEDGGNFKQTDFEYQVQGYCNFRPGRGVALLR